MTPDDDRLSERVDGLYVSYGELLKTTGSQGEWLRAHDREFAGLRTTRREDIENVMKALERIDSTCSTKVESVKVEIRKQAEIHDANKWSRPQWIAVLAAVFGPTLAFVALIAGMGAPT